MGKIGHHSDEKCSLITGCPLMGVSLEDQFTVLQYNMKKMTNYSNQCLTAGKQAISRGYGLSQLVAVAILIGWGAFFKGLSTGSNFPSSIS